MKLSALIGKWVIREKPALSDGVSYDWEFNTQPIKVEKVLSCHCYYRPAKDKPVKILDGRYLDDSWVEVDQIYWS